MKHARLLIPAALGMMALVVSPALAEIHYFTLSDTLYRSDSGAALTSVSIDLGSTAEFPGLAFDSSGTLWGSETSGTNRNFYTINPATGATNFEFSYGASTGGTGIISFDFRTVAGVEQIFGVAGNTVYQFNAGTGAFIASNSQGGGGGYPTTAYDAATATYYGVRSSDKLLQELQIDAGTPPAGVALTGVGNYSLAGGAWFGSEYWSGFFNSGAVAGGIINSGTVRLGTINTGTGAFTNEYTFVGLGDQNAMGYAVIPAPGAFVLGALGLGMVGWIKRRFV